MNKEVQPTSSPVHLLVSVRHESHGQYTAQIVGFSEIQATAAGREEAVHQVRSRAAESFATGQLVAVRLASENPWLKHAGWARDDPDFGIYIEEVLRARQEDFEHTLPGADLPCSDSSSTPTI